MPRYRIPIELDLRSLPARGTVVSVELDIPTILAHMGSTDEWRACGLHAAFPDKKQELAQFNPGVAADLHWTVGRAPQVCFAVPGEVAASDETVVQLELSTSAPAAPPAVVLEQGPDAVTIHEHGRHLATYRYNTKDPDLPRPYFHPVIGPAGATMTQDGEFPGTKKGHIWHTGLFLAHQKFTDGNNWQTGSPEFSRMRHVRFDAMQSGPVQGRFVERLEWLNVKGDRVLFRETRTVTIPARKGEQRCIDVDTTITCGDQPVTWEATPYHLLAVRVPDSMLVSKGGVITNSEGAANPKDGSPAAWMDYSGPVGGSTVGVALMAHPRNLRYPVPFLNFQNETIGAAPTHREPYAWKPGESLRFRYRTYLHAGDVKAGGVAAEYAAWSTVPASRIGAPVRVA